MAGGLQGGGGIRRRRRGHRRSYTPMSDINVTPFVDVMLVLLIVFMVTAPLLTVGVPVDLPKSQASPINENTEPLVVTVDRNGSIYIQETEVPFENLVTRLNAITERKPDTRIFVRGDREIAYGRVMQVMGRLNGAGFEKVALITEQDEQG
ncbi:protein TolR [Rhodovibrio salinarum]|uniref:Tol-Pal system protein TolR n=1 Tax=Rhodovibrio salinarum TaxID=1087 RepID=A0A934QIC3_9PROT|nr:protein TolR [Rhodovibrio salinarum]MBK1697323.1 protein TolR [Rhodovibrio salinarum]